MFRATGFSFRWVSVSLAASFALHSAISAADETRPSPVVRGELVIEASPAARAHAAGALRTVVLPEVTVTGSRVQALPRGYHVPCKAGRGVVEHGRKDARGVPLPSAARCL